MRYDVAVVGLGGMGSAIIAQAAKRGASVIGLEQFSRGHDLGSSSGKSRMIRKAYFENPAYVPLLLRAYDLWRELERETQPGATAPDRTADGGQRGLRDHRRRDTGGPGAFLAFRIARCTTNPVALSQCSKSWMKKWEFTNRTAACSNPERAICAHLNVAEAAGAQIRFEAAMESWEPTAAGFTIRLANGTTVTTRALVLSLGAWFKNAMEKLGVTVRVQRNVQAWFDSASNVYAAPNFPPFLLDREGLPAPLYGFPDFGDGVKAAFHCYGDLIDTANFNREVDATRDIEPIMRAMEDWMPGAATVLRSAKPCLYTITPDGHFVVDRHPEHPRLVLCGGFSGHGFKFAPVIGEIGADLALEQGTRHEIEFLSLQRFAQQE